MQKTVSEKRKLYIGGSDIPIILGISLFTTRWELLQFKAGLTTPTFQGNEYTEYGNVMEEKIRDYINKKYQKNYQEGKHTKEQKIIGSRIHTDGEDEDSILEIKTTSQIKTKLDDYKIYLSQLLYYMNEEKKENGKLAVYLRTDDFNVEFDEKKLQVFDIKLSDYQDLIKEIYQEIDNFKEDLVKIKENPFITEEELYPEELVNLVGELAKIEDDYKKISKSRDEVKGLLLEAMISNCRKKIKINNNIATFVEGTKDTKVLKFDEDSFKEKESELYQKYLVETTKKGKAGYILFTRR